MKICRIRAAAATVAAALFLSCQVCATPAVSADASILMDADSGRVLFEKNADQQSLIASTTKIMTALVVCEQCNLADRVKIPKEAVGIEGSSLYLQEGEILTVQDLLYGLMLHSGNDAAVALAIYCGGTEADFVTLMNEKAQRLGLQNTGYANPHGLDHDGNFSTARDLAKLSAYALQNEDFLRTVSCKTVTIGERVLQNHNKMLFRYEGAIGVKTGYTKAAGRILVSAAERDGRCLIAVTINDPDDWNDHADLLDYGFSGFQAETLVKTGEILGEVTVIGGDTPSVSVAAAEDFAMPMAEAENFSVDLHLPMFLYAPVAQGSEAGTASIKIGETVVGEIPLYCTEEIARLPERQSWMERLLGG